MYDCCEIIRVVESIEVHPWQNANIYKKNQKVVITLLSYNKIDWHYLCDTAQEMSATMNTVSVNGELVQW